MDTLTTSTLQIEQLHKHSPCDPWFKICNFWIAKLTKILRAVDFKMVNINTIFRGLTTIYISVEHIHKVLYSGYYWQHLNWRIGKKTALDCFLIWWCDLLLYCLCNYSLNIDKSQRFCQIVKLKASSIILAIWYALHKCSKSWPIWVDNNVYRSNRKSHQILLKQVTIT